jgi:BirA family biotin operon repressor/biotin-[acetyl-CoA-carboxylase] ligase
MKQLDIQNPFGGPVHYIDSCESTMDDARRLAESGARHGTAVMAGLQTRGRGRRETRRWTASAGKNLTFTLILRYHDFSRIPAAITLRAGIAVARAIEAEAPALREAVAVKWPNDVMLNGKKCAGIIAESDSSAVMLGIGVNIMENFKDMPLAGAAYQATSIAVELAEFDAEAAATYAETPDKIPRFLEKVLFSLFHTLSSGFDESWRQEFENRLYMRGRIARFAAGGVPADKNCPPRLVTGTIAGIDPGGSILILSEGAETPEAFSTGELTSDLT